ncbi:hypothetical protein SAMN05660649_02513 [Desulfotomaculum arcticum]|uniref:Uncharacterized protein n=1 Tax=Desulfotruncus arcticus DSM 17038 TaxID=1121424 RepID=A0A1I2U5C3_9FIRM|nr:hypothetical protein [Desulfotruncus arcticus]SFG72355.1 hypothetical protein SAMN05660649_02513 [Desulfotomaculum arcticum] [Desulfotruncus arcticus DSM 17038]
MSELCNSVKASNCYQEIIEHAIKYAAEKTTQGNMEETVDKLRQLNPLTHSYFRYAVAKKTWELLCKADPLLVNGYILGEHEERKVSHSESLYLVILAKRKTAAISSLINDLCQGLLTEYKRVMEERAKDLQIFMLIELIDRQDLLQRSGMLLGIHLPPAKLNTDTSIIGM